MAWFYPAIGVTCFLVLYLAMWRFVRNAGRELREIKKEIPVSIFARRLHGKGFAAYVNGSASEGTADIMLDLHAILWSCADSPGETWSRVASESCVHEMLHVFQELLEREFDCDEIERCIEAARRQQAD